jgi:hypothetical protein
MKLIRIFEYGSVGRTSEKTYWTLPVEELSTAQEVANTIANKLSRGDGSYTLCASTSHVNTLMICNCSYEISLDGMRERQLGTNELVLVSYASRELVLFERCITGRHEQMDGIQVILCEAEHRREGLRRRSQ